MHKALAVCIDQGLDPESDAVQKIIHVHYQMICRFYDCTKEIYVGLTHLYVEHPGFKKIFDAYHLRMIEYIGEAMRFYAEKNL